NAKRAALQPPVCVISNPEALWERAKDPAEILDVGARPDRILDQPIDVAHRRTPDAIITGRFVEARVQKRPRRLRRQNAVAARARVGRISIKAIDATADT